MQKYYESLIRHTDDLDATRKVCVEPCFEIVSFVIECLGSWIVAFYVYVNNV